MRLRLGPVEHDLTTRALVLGVLDAPAARVFAPAAGAALDAVLARADRLVGEGADVLDVGGVHTGAEAGGAAVDEAEELERVGTVVAALRARFDVPLAVATWRASVLASSWAAGAAVGHDHSGFVDDAYLPTAARVGATVIATHTRLSAGAADLVGEVRRFLGDRVDRARAAGLPDDRIVVDPGLDLGKSSAQSLTLLRETAALADLGPALLLDAARPRFLGAVLDLDADGRRMAGHAAAALGIARGCRIVRTDDVTGARRVADVLEALLTARLAQVVLAPVESGPSLEAADG